MAIPDTSAPDLDLTLRLDAGWQHAFWLFLPRQLVTYRDAGTSFLVAGTPLARDAALVQAGFDLSLGAATLFLAYDGSLPAPTRATPSAAASIGSFDRQLRPSARPRRVASGARICLNSYQIRGGGRGGGWNRQKAWS